MSSTCCDSDSSSQQGDEDGAGQADSASRRITLAKAVLAEATSTLDFQHLPPAAVSKNAPRNTGALGPLLVMLQSCSDLDKLRTTLDTFSFLLLDKGNRKIACELNSLDVLLGLLRRLQDQTALLSTLDALMNLLKHDVKDKLLLWKHQNKGALMSLIAAKQPAAVTVEALLACRTLGFASTKSQLLEPALLTVVAEVLHPSADARVLLKALRFLEHASTLPNTQQLGGWHTCVFRLAPLLSSCTDSAVRDAAMTVLLGLSEHAHFRNMFYAAGCIAPLLQLLNDRECSISNKAACVLGSLSEGGLSRDKLCQEPALMAMLRVLQCNHCVEVTIAVLYMLSRLCAYKEQVVRSLKHWGAVPVLLDLLQASSDEDAALGTLQLLEVLGAHSPTPSRQGSDAIVSVPMSDPTVAATTTQLGSHSLLSSGPVSVASDMAVHIEAGLKLLCPSQTAAC